MKKLIASILLGIFVLGSSGITMAKILTPGDYYDTYKHWASPYIKTVSEKQIMQGVGVSKEGYRLFAPDQTVTRAQLATTLSRTFDFDYGDIKFVKKPVASDYYNDVKNDSWYAEALTYCAINNIFEPSENFKPEKAVTRIEIAQAIYNSFIAKNISVPMIMLMPMYEDTKDLTPTQTNAMVFVSNTGIMKGYNNYFRPHDKLTRAELAVVLARCIDLIEKNETDNKN